MAVTVRVTGVPLHTLRLTDRALMQNLGLLARERILRRTKAGVDAHGWSFKGYSPTYQLAKGRATGHGGVDLTLSGQMLDALRVTRVTDREAVLGFVGR